MFSLSLLFGCLFSLCHTPVISKQDQTLLSHSCSYLLRKHAAWSSSVCLKNCVSTRQHFIPYVSFKKVLCAVLNYLPSYCLLNGLSVNQLLISSSSVVGACCKSEHNFFSAAESQKERNAFNLLTCSMFTFCNFEAPVDSCLASLRSLLGSIRLVILCFRVHNHTNTECIPLTSIVGYVSKA